MGCNQLTGEAHGHLMHSLFCYRIYLVRPINVVSNHVWLGYQTFDVSGHELVNWVELASQAGSSYNQLAWVLGVLVIFDQMKEIALS